MLTKTPACPFLWCWSKTWKHLPSLAIPSQGVFLKEEKSKAARIKHIRQERAVCRMQGKKFPRKSHLKTSVRPPAWPNVVLPQKGMKIYFITEFLRRACSFLREYCSSVLRNSPRTLSQTHKLPQVCSKQAPSNIEQLWFAFPVACILVLFEMLKAIPLSYRTKGSQRDWHVMGSRQTSHLASQDLCLSFPTHSPGRQLPAPRFCPALLERTQKCRSAQAPAASQG